MDEERLRVEVVGPVATVTMARPAQRNALGPELIADLTAAFRRVGNQDGVRVVVLAGEGKVFSAGADLDYMRRMGEAGSAENVADALRVEALFRAVRDCPRPVVARVQGAAMGGGVGLVAAADIAVAADDAVFAFSEARLGLVPAVISPFVVPRIGLSAARELFLTGERFDAARARELGLVSRLVPAAELDAAVDERVEALLACAPGSQTAIKRLLRFLETQPPDERRSYTAHLIAARRASEEGRAGTSAFLAGEAPPWG
jgi:methylglutaconyl-CoA hydratase